MEEFFKVWFLYWAEYLGLKVTRMLKNNANFNIIDYCIEPFLSCTGCYYCRWLASKTSNLGKQVAFHTDNLCYLLSRGNFSPSSNFSDIPLLWKSHPEKDLMALFKRFMRELTKLLWRTYLHLPYTRPGVLVGYCIT